MKNNDLPQTFRSLFVYLYYSLCAAFVVVVAYGATYGAFSSVEAQHEADASQAQPRLPFPDCRSRLINLRQSLNREALRVFEDLLVGKAGDQWTTWSSGWRTSTQILRKTCIFSNKEHRKLFRHQVAALGRYKVAIDMALNAFGVRGLKAIQAMDTL